MNILTSLTSISNYPISADYVNVLAAKHGLSVEDEFDAGAANSDEYKMCSADVYDFLAVAPNVSQGGISFSFSESERSMFRKKAAELRAEAKGGASVYGWQGEDF